MTVRSGHWRRTPTGRTWVEDHDLNPRRGVPTRADAHLVGDTRALTLADPFATQTRAEAQPDVVATFDPGTDTRETAFDRCYLVHADLAERAEAAGHEVRLLCLTGPTTPMPDAHAEWLDLDRRWSAVNADYGGQRRWVHYVAEIDGVAYDFTARQFDPAADYPAVVDPTEWREQDLHVDLPGGYGVKAAADECPARVRAAAAWASDTDQTLTDVLGQWRTERERSRRLLGPSPTFVHFTDEAGAAAITESGELRSGGIENTVFAVAAGANHEPNIQRGTTTDHGFGVVEGGRHHAVVFTTDETPEGCWPAEVWWKRDRPLRLRQARVATADEAARMLDGSANLPDEWDG